MIRRKMYFLEKVVDDIYKQENGFKKTAIVFPTKRSGLFFKKYLQENKDIKKPLWAPELFSISKFVDYLSNNALSNKLKLLFILYEIYRKVENNPKDFDIFYQWGRIMLSDFEDIDNYMVDTDELFRQIKEAKNMEKYFKESDKIKKNETYKKYVDFSENIEKIYNKFQTSLDKSNNSYYGKEIKNIVTNFEDFRKKINKWENIYFVGFNALSNAEIELINTLDKYKNCNIYWNMDKFFVEKKNHEAGYFFRRNNKKLNIKSNKFIEDELRNKSKNIKIIGTPKKISQTKILGHCLKKFDNLDENSGIILPDESLLFPLMHSIPDKIDNINVTMGFPLKNTPVYNLISNILQLHENKEKLDKKNCFYFEDVKQVLMHPYIMFISDENNIEFINNLKIKNKIFIKEKDFDNFNKKVKYIFQSIKSVEEFIEYLKNIFNSITDMIKTKDIYTIELEYIYKFFTVIQKIEDILIEYSHNFSLLTFWRLFKEIIESERIPFIGEPLKGLQIMGMLETRNLDFRNVFILSVNEGVLPASKSNNSFIPYEIKKSFNLPTYEYKDSLFSYYFYRLIMKAENVYLIYNTETDEFGKGEKSRFIEQLFVDLKNKNDNLNIKEDIVTLKINTEKKYDFKIKKNKEIMKLLKKNIEYSPTKLITYLQCPVKFYLKYILNLKEQEQIKERADYSEFGSIVHGILEEIFSKYVNKSFTREDINNEIKNIESLIKRKYKNVLGNVEVKSGKNYLNIEIIKELVTKYLKKEHNLEVLEVERLFETNFDYKGNKIKIKGRIDRISKVDEIIEIIDYKTGSVYSTTLRDYKIEDYNSIQKVLSRKKEVLQLLIYFYLIVENKNYKSYDCFKSTIVGFKDITDPKQTLNIKSNEDSLLNRDNKNLVEDILIKIFDDIFNENKFFEKTDDEKKCRNCVYKDICLR